MYLIQPQHLFNIGHLHSMFIICVIAGWDGLALNTGLFNTVFIENMDTNRMETARLLDFARCRIAGLQCSIAGLKCRIAGWQDCRIEVLDCRIEVQDCRMAGL